MNRDGMSEEERESLEAQHQKAQKLLLSHLGISIKKEPRLEPSPTTSTSASAFASTSASSFPSTSVILHDARGEPFVLKSATGGFGLRAEPTEQEKRQREEEDNIYSLSKKRQRIQEENLAYVNNRQQISADFESGIIAGVEYDKDDDDEDDEQPAGLKTEPIYDPADSLFYTNADYNFFNHEYNKELKIYQHRQEIIDALNRNNIVIIQGNTGCGKTTQVPQFILDEHARMGYRCRIIVTQPRRIAARSVSNRVCVERNWAWGSVCGYRVSMERRTSEETRIFYVTTGYLLEMIVADQDELKKYTHVVLDEIHDRDLDTDLVLLLVKILLIQRINIKVVLMSATLNPEELCNFFGKLSTTEHIPIVRCDSQMFEVKKYFLDDIQTKLIKSELKIEFKINEPKIQDDQLDILIKLLHFIDSKEVDNLSKEECTINGFAPNRGAVLIFVPGMDDINRVEQFIKHKLPHAGFVYCQLHSEIALEQQMRVFERCQAGERKIIISTSIAESSITVHDIKFVVDFCLTKAPYTDELTHFTSLELAWATRSNTKQRCGRAGRVDRGIYFCLVDKEFYSSLREFPSPAIEREPLDKVILNIKRFSDNQPPKKVLSMALTVPDLSNIESTINVLKQVGALTLYKKGEACSYDGDLTFAGEIMASLPVDIRLGKLIVMGHAFGRLKEAIIIAAGLSVKNIINKFYKSNLEFYKRMFELSGGLMCDFNAILNLYLLSEQDRQMKKKAKNNKTTGILSKHGVLDKNHLREMNQIIKQIEHRLESFGIKCEPSDLNDDAFNPRKRVADEMSALDQYYIIKFMCAAAFYPNYFRTHVEDDSDHIIRMLNGKNPKTTVSIKIQGFDQKAILYHNKFKKMFEAFGNDVILHYEQHKAYAEFRDSYEISDKIVAGVYYALVADKLRLAVPEIDKKQQFFARAYIDLMRSLESGNYSRASTSRITAGSRNFIEDASLLLNDLNEFHIKIVLISNLNFFWAHVNEPKYQQKLEYISDKLNGPDYNFKLIEPKDLFVGRLVVTMFIDISDGGITNDFYRAKIIKKTDTYVEVLYIDYGNSEKKDFTLMFEMSEELTRIPCQAFQCQLAHARVNPFLDEVKRDEKICEVSTMFRNVKNLRARVYSIVDNIVRITLIDADHPIYEYDLFNSLEKIGLYERCEESQISKNNNQLRNNVSYIIPERNADVEQRSRNEWINIENFEQVLNDLKFDEQYELRLRIESPLQTRVDGVTQATRGKRAEPDLSSVNRVILDDDPAIKSSNLLVAYRIDLKKEPTEKYVLRHTSLFPKVRGIVSICLLAFSPHVELRASRRDKIYTGALCGLGFDREKNRPLFMENDIEDKFEVQFTDRDIERLNGLRAQINTLIANNKESKQLIANRKLLNNYQIDVRQSLLQLLKEKRTPIDTPRFPDCREYHWNKLDEDNYKPLKSKEQDMINLRKKNRIFYTPIRLVDFSTLPSKKN